MADIVERLRGLNVDYTDRHEIYAVVKEAADEIERLRDALKKIIPIDIHHTELPNGSSVGCGPIAIIAKHALGR